MVWLVWFGSAIPTRQRPEHDLPQTDAPLHLLLKAVAAKFGPPTPPPRIDLIDLDFLLFLRKSGSTKFGSFGAFPLIFLGN